MYFYYLSQFHFLSICPVILKFRFCCENCCNTKRICLNARHNVSAIKTCVINGPAGVQCAKQNLDTKKRKKVTPHCLRFFHLQKIYYKCTYFSILNISLLDILHNSRNYFLNN